MAVSPEDIPTTYQKQVQEKEEELERDQAHNKTELRNSHTTFQKQTEAGNSEVERSEANYQTESREHTAKSKTEITELQSVHEREQLRKENKFSQKQEKQLRNVQASRAEAQQSLVSNLVCKMYSPIYNTCTHNLAYAILKLQIKQLAKDPVKLTWRQGKAAPDVMNIDIGIVVVHDNTAYFSDGFRAYSYTPTRDEWTQLPKCPHHYFGMAVVHDKVTTIGGMHRCTVTTTLLCLEDKWIALLPPMRTARVKPTTVTTPTHLIVAGGDTKQGNALLTIEILDTNTFQWSSASSLPETLKRPQMSLCGEHLYLAKNNTIFSCSVDELLKSCKPAPTNSSAGESVWTKLADIPVPYGASLTTLRGQVLAIGGAGCATRWPSNRSHSPLQQEYRFMECHWRDALATIWSSSRSPTQQ